MPYEIEGRLLEVCTCNVLCPCWVGEDPDYKTCDTTIAWGIEKGTIEGVDVDGLTIAVSAHIPKNILEPKSWKAIVLVDERASPEQQDAMLRLFTGQLGGAIADLAGLIGEVVGVERAPITFSVEGGNGRLTIGEIVHAEMTPYVGATGNPGDRAHDDKAGEEIAAQPRAEMRRVRTFLPEQAEMVLQRLGRGALCGPVSDLHGALRTTNSFSGH